MSGEPLVNRRIVLVKRDKPVKHVLLKVRVVGYIAAGQGLADDVDVAVDQTRRHHEAAAIDCLLRCNVTPQVVGFTNCHNPIAFPGNGAVENDPAFGIHGNDSGARHQCVGGERGAVQIQVTSTSEPVDRLLSMSRWAAATSARG